MDKQFCTPYGTKKSAAIIEGLKQYGSVTLGIVRDMAPWNKGKEMLGCYKLKFNGRDIGRLDHGKLQFYTWYHEPASWFKKYGDGAKMGKVYRIVAKVIAETNV